MSGRPGEVDPGHLAAPVAVARPPLGLSDLLPRTLSGIVLVAVAVGATVAGGWSFAGLWWLAGATIAWEWQAMIGRGGLTARTGVAVLAVTIATALVLGGLPGVAALALMPAAAVLSVLAGGQHGTLSGAGVVYAGVLPVCMVMLRSSDPLGAQVIWWLFAVVWGTDIMAYFGGRLMGGPKLWRQVSPSKTWSGFLTGILSGAVAGWLVGRTWQAGWQVLPLGLAVGSIAQAGDLFESSLKRRFGVKDSSRIIPGHGGVMDRLDGFLTAAVFVAGFGVMRAGLVSPSGGVLQW